MAPPVLRRRVLPLTDRHGPSWWRRLRESRRLYRARHGDHLAAAVTFFTVLALVPLLMLAVSAVGFVLSSSQTVFARIEQTIGAALPQPVSTQVVDVVHVVVAERGTLGVIGLAAAAVSGWSWISHLRDAVTALLGRPCPERRLRHAHSDVVALLGIGLALAVSFGLATLTGIVGSRLLDLLGVTATVGPRAVLAVGSIVIGLVANWLVVAWGLAHLPRPARPVRPLLRAAAVAAVGLAVLQQLGGLYLRLLGGSPALTTLGGALIGLLLIVYVVVRWLFLVTVWTDTDAPDSVSDRSEAGRAGIELVADLIG
ncbi:YihY/virulence factor BrkB family protein [Pseudonocardia endophytica]|uniref:Membrane protein n=1 Tax=Pseudonocardia endophytica TaxID=401976 RepID=A0A4R1HK59_PSEEN|nr:YhjD/YihY/BrkB family envelope integrity protein [Pseudonocardia endophytica]TCK22248.1 membrane protein [Pseudonocardia endophytica]